ncbi:MAG: hypothetical protein K0Q73_7707 [Paenibacillus sp.]|jgi:hypothetical protein|nr:hypothetical protein [Paenibacillus sp.]
MNVVQFIRTNKGKAVWLFPVVIFCAGLIPGVMDSMLWHVLGAILFLAVLSIAISGLIEFQWAPKKTCLKYRKVRPAAAAQQWEMIQRRVSA